MCLGEQWERRLNKYYSWCVGSWDTGSNGELSCVNLKPVFHILPEPCSLLPIFHTLGSADLGLWPQPGVGGSPRRPGPVWKSTFLPGNWFFLQVVNPKKKMKKKKYVNSGTVTLLSFAVESECTFLDYIKGG